MSPVISVENLGKRYRIHHQQVNGMRYKALRDVLADKTKSTARRLWSAVRNPWSRLARHSEAKAGSPWSVVSSPHSEDFWALKNVSFEVQQGEVLGIIGRNGAGKSTLLKILSRITEPTEGRVRIKGRVASLLEVGTGFHPELTGRENIFLNGAILGMTKAEIKSKFDEIVAFAEVEKFLDTPVKRYSSGMYVRLAFAVAAHLEPEILIVDEVLAVGDAEFQKKCLGKMETVSRKEGRTVLFVSHNMQAVQQLTASSIVLQSGRVAFAGSTDVAVVEYLKKSGSPEASCYEVTNARRRISGTMAAKFERLWFPNGKASLDLNDDLRFRVRVTASTDLPSVCFSITINSLTNGVVGSGFSNNIVRLAVGQSTELDLRLQNPRLAPGEYSCIVGMAKEGWLGSLVLYDVVFDVLFFEVKQPRNTGVSAVTWPSAWGNVVFDKLTTTERVFPSPVCHGRESVTNVSMAEDSL
jgi:lipopolysaccharide transport system ATP-binding protein